MKGHLNEQKLRQFYGQYVVVILLVLVIFILGVLYITNWNDTIIWLSIGLIIILLLIGYLFLVQLHAKVARVIQTVDAIVEGAMSGHPRISGFEETTLSSLEHKVIRYVEMVQAMEHKQQEEQRKINTLISDISHQTKTPLANIILYSQLLEERLESGDKLHSIVEQIGAQSEKLDWLIQSLIKMSRLEAGIIRIQAEVQPVFPTICKAVAQIKAAAVAKNILIDVHCSPTIQAKHDSNWTCEAFINLLENAVKYSPNAGHIKIAVYEGEMFTRLDITDTGIGIAEHELNLVFQRFYRCANTAQYEGVGIGLYLAREIIVSQGGYIKATSQLNEGSVFSLFLPASS